MVMDPRLKQIIFDKLYEDLKDVEIIPHDRSIWFIDVKEKCWYFEYREIGVLWWRWDFFDDFFNLFSLTGTDCAYILSEWVEEVLNCKVNSTGPPVTIEKFWVEEVLNCKVNSTSYSLLGKSFKVEEVLVNYRP
jgi:hypothetical protein